jgi:ATP-dependent Clp protease ATP-binding subunit ClpC
MYERFTDRARKVMQLANQEAQRFNHEYIGAEHVLLGLIKEGSGIAGTALKNRGITVEAARREVEKFHPSGPDVVVMGKLPQTPRAKKVIEYSMEEARNLNHNYVGTEHIVLGLLREQEGVAGRVLMGLGLTLEAVREEVLNLLGQGPNTPEKEIERTGVRAAPIDFRDWQQLSPGATWDAYCKSRNEIERLEIVIGYEAAFNNVAMYAGVDGLATMDLQEEALISMAKATVEAAEAAGKER